MVYGRGDAVSIGTLLPEVLAECGIDRVSPTINESTPEMRQMRALMDAAGRDINARAEWSRGLKTLTLTAVADAALPVDFHRMTEGGAVVTGDEDHTPVLPVVSPQMWQLMQKAPPEQLFYHLDAGRIYFTDTVVTVTVRYLSTYWLGTLASIASNDNVPIFPERLLTRGTIWRWKRQKGLPYDDVMAEFEADLEHEIRADRGA